MKYKVFFTSLGCSKNLIDAEVMMYLLEHQDYEIIEDETKADVIIINTCGFIVSAKEESIEAIFSLARNKQFGRCKALIVSGCLAERYHGELAAEIPEADAIIGTGDYKNIVEIVQNVLEGNRIVLYGHQNEIDLELLPRKHTEGNAYAYLKIAEGCDNRCTYCIIPYLRGKLQSRSMESIVAEAEQLAVNGITELILIAQDTTKYGVDIYGSFQLPTLLKKIAAIDGIHWIRILYAYPDSFTQELIDCVAEEPKICKYFDIPIQHISDRVLKRMGRHTSKAQIEALIFQLRKQIPDVSLRTTLMVGFPGEMEDDFAQLLSFVKEARFDKLGVFEYSREENTPAYRLDQQVDDIVKTERRNQIMELQQRISYENNQQMLGQTIEVLVEEWADGVYVGRSAKDAPEIDGLVYITSEEPCELGNYYFVRIDQALEYDLKGVRVK